MKKITLMLIMLLAVLTTTKTYSQDPYLGEIRMVAFNFAPQGWALCQGQTMSISQNQALFALLGTTFGGDGIQTFKLPDMRGRIPMGQGNGPGLTPADMGQSSGTETNTLTVSQMPAHNHAINAVSSEGTQNNPAGNLPADTKGLDKEYSNSAANVTMNPTMVSSTGSNAPINNMQPYLTVNFIIATQGIFPPRN